MANDYYDPAPVDVPTSATALSSHIDNVSLAVETAFDNLPDPHSGAPTTKGFGENVELEGTISDENHAVTAKDVREGVIDYVSAGGTANAITATMSPAITSYTEGLKVRVKIGTTNTGGVTIALNGLAATAVKRTNGDALEAYDLVADAVVTLEYDGTNFQLTTPSTYYQDMASESIPAASTGSEGDLIQVSSGGAYELTSTPIATTPATTDDSTLVATTAFVKDVVLGQGQTWTDVLTIPGRAIGSTYTNSTSAPIFISITTATWADAYAINYLIDGTTVGKIYNPSGYGNISLVVPPGSTYGLTSLTTTTITYWWELR